MARFDTKESLGRLMGSVFIGVGSLIALAGLIWLIRTIVFVSGAAEAPGQITAMERSSGSKGRSMYHPVFAFKDAAGIVHTQRSSIGSSSFSFEVGENVTILYDSTAPKHSKIKSFESLWLGPLFMSGFGLLFGGFASFWLFMWIRGSRLLQ